MTQVLTEKAIKQLIKKTQAKVARLPKKEVHIDTTVLRSEPAENQEEVDALFAHMKKREF